MRFGRIGLTTGPRLRYAEQGDRDGEAVVLLHGWPDSWFSFSRVLALLPAGFRALALDQRGFGESDHPESGYRIEDFAADVVAFLDALGIERASLVGHSYGSFVARCVAINAPARVSRLVLIGSGFAKGNQVLADVQASVRDLPDPIPVDFAREFQSGTVHVPVPDDFFDRIIAESMKIPARLWPMMIDTLMAYDDADALRAIRCPTLLLWGDHDALFSRADQDRLIAALPDVGLTIYDDTGHCPNWERPERVAADIRVFLEST